MKPPFRVICINAEPKSFWEKKEIKIKKGKVYTVTKVINPEDDENIFISEPVYILKEAALPKGSAGYGSHRFIMYKKNLPKDEV